MGKKKKGGGKKKGAAEDDGELNPDGWPPNALRGEFFVEAPAGGATGGRAVGNQPTETAPSADRRLEAGL